MQALTRVHRALVFSLALAGCIPEAPARECDSHGCDPGYFCRLSDGRCERNTVDPKTLCGNVYADLLTDRRRCGRCEPTSCLTCEGGECSVARGILATNETALVLPWTAVGLVQQWRGWGKPVFEDGVRSIPFPLVPTVDGGIPPVASTPVIASRDFDAHSTREVALCALYPDVGSQPVRGTLCVVRDGVVRCAGQPLPQEDSVDGGAVLRWRVVNALRGSTVLACARRDAAPMGACAWSPERRQIRCQASWLDPAREVAIEPDVACRFDGGTSAFEAVESIGMGRDFACALAVICGQRAVLCWGATPSAGAGCVPDGAPVIALPSTARVIALPSTPRDLTVGFEHACAVLESGEVWCWGASVQARLGRGNLGDSRRCDLPAPVLRAEGTPLTAAREVHAFKTRTCARVEENAQGVVYCWGESFFLRGVSSCTGTSNIVDNPDRYATRVELGGAGPLHVSNESWGRDVLAVGNGFACALAADGHDVFCWGRGTLGRGYFPGVTYNPPCPVTF